MNGLTKSNRLFEFINNDEEHTDLFLSSVLNHNTCVWLQIS